jgi:hypothetical protein
MAFRLPPKAAPTAGTPSTRPRRMDQSREAHHSARPHHSPEGPKSYGGSGLLLLQVVADYTRLSAVQNHLGGLDSGTTDHADE